MFDPKINTRVGSLGINLGKCSAEHLVSKLQEAIDALSDTHQDYVLVEELRDIETKLRQKTQGLQQYYR